MGLRQWITPLAAAIMLTSSPLYAASMPAVEAQNGMVVSSQYLASQIGVDILKMGGNAIDAAVAVGYAQAVVNPCCGNIGGGGFMTIHLANGRDTFINFRETAPAAASANMYLDAQGNVKKNASLYGYLAAGVPGTVMGLDTAQRQYGKLTRAQVMAPAIKLARQGFILTRADTDILDTTVSRFKQDPVPYNLVIGWYKKIWPIPWKPLPNKGPMLFITVKFPPLLKVRQKRGAAC